MLVSWRYCVCLRIPLIDASFSCVCPVVDHEFRHDIVKVAVDPRGESQVNVQTMRVPAY